jgi:hypothetical protein
MAHLVRGGQRLRGARTAVTVDRLEQGIRVPDDILSRLTADDELVNEKDAAAEPPERLSSA